ncbi:hypothetical protein MKZ38_000894 [Zalerion maritima]|uniref:Las1-like protein n=1 Tax=Zalerion maritima TaxID=339359 RepID=A0AAD5WVN9_9PEZI|nr:hypothetical protein MKZ38_000894 [Zalerion maritima]
MVQYIFTPWRNREELLRVRKQFFPQRIDDNGFCISASSPLNTNSNGRNDRVDNRRAAVGRAQMWVNRGHCPHLVEATAQIMSARLADEACAGGSDRDTLLVSLGYSAAFSRFVTGLLDSHQEAQKKMSMYSVAKSVGLPASFVELRHQVTHEQLPSLTKLRAAADKALDWIWERYWKEIPAPSARAATRLSTSAPAKERDDAAEKALLAVKEIIGNEDAWEARWTWLAEHSERIGDRRLMDVVNQLSRKDTMQAEKLELLAKEVMDRMFASKRKREAGDDEDGEGGAGESKGKSVLKDFRSMRKEMEMFREMMMEGSAAAAAQSSSGPTPDFVDEEGMPPDEDEERQDPPQDTVTKVEERAPKRSRELIIPPEGDEIGWWEFQGPWNPTPIGAV